MLEDLSCRFEPPSPLTRWDTPLFRVCPVKEAQSETLAPLQLGFDKQSIASVNSYDLDKKEKVCAVAPEFEVGKKGSVPCCTCLCWSMDGASLFTGYTDNVIRVWDVKSM